MDEYGLLVTHAARWAADKMRQFDDGVVELALDLRGTHDQLNPNYWPAGSVKHLMLVRWPSHGPLDEPDVKGIAESLETFFRFLRATGRLASGSADVADLVAETKAAGKKMKAACADPDNYGQAKSIQAFGRDIGLFTDEPFESEEEMQSKFAEVVAAFNALPYEERARRLPAPGSQGSLPGEAMTRAAGNALFGGSSGPAWPGAPLPDDEDGGEDDMIYHVPPEVSMPGFQTCPLVSKLKAMGEWIGDGKAVTAVGYLRPALARELYDTLDLFDWERQKEHYRGKSALWTSSELAEQRGDFRDGWRSAGECWPIARLWDLSLALGLVTLSGREAHYHAEVWPAPAQYQEWRNLFGVTFSEILESSLWGVRANLDTLFVILGITLTAKKPPTLDVLQKAWLTAPANPLLGVPEAVRRRFSDMRLADTLNAFGDFALWTEKKGKFGITELGRDVLLLVVQLQDTLPNAADWPEAPTS